MTRSIQFYDEKHNIVLETQAIKIINKIITLEDDVDRNDALFEEFRK